VPKDKTDLTKGGKLQALQVMSMAHPGQPIEFHAGQADADILSQDMKDLHTYGNRFDSNWVTLHDTDVDGNAPFDANALAKAKHATPFKRPENAQFRPGSQFREFYFDETGDTNLLTQAPDHGGFGSVMKLVQASPSANKGKLSMFYKGDTAHSGFDNVAFLSWNKIVFVEDAGDGLHSQRNAFDSGFMLDVDHDYADGTEPVRILALGRDPSATLDSWIGTLGIPFQNEGDNEITGIHVSDGDPTAYGLLGAKMPQPFHDGWRVFYTQQHGDNQTFEILPAGGCDRDGKFERF
jgi:secreted PhoX family phosphatase